VRRREEKEDILRDVQEEKSRNSKLFKLPI
jgi:hypothetical protein